MGRDYRTRDFRSSANAYVHAGTTKMIKETETAPVHGVVRRWRRSPPNRDGWWLFREQSINFDQRVLILDGVVACDYEVAIWSGVEEDDVDNYWEGNNPVEMTDGTLTRGLWKFDAAPVAPVERLVRQRWPKSVSQMMARFRRSKPPHKRKSFQIAIVVHAIDRETAIDELEHQLAILREDRVGQGGGGGFGFSMSYAIVDGE